MYNRQNTEILKLPYIYLSGFHGNEPVEVFMAYLQRGKTLVRSSPPPSLSPAFCCMLILYFFAGACPRPTTFSCSLGSSHSLPHSLPLSPVLPFSKVQFICSGCELFFCFRALWRARWRQVFLAPDSRQLPLSLSIKKLWHTNISLKITECGETYNHLAHLLM